MKHYALVTPAHNEGVFIGQTACAVVAQELRPVRWVIVDDASTDDTAEIAHALARVHNFISVVSLTRAPGRHFANKVKAFDAGLRMLDGLDCAFIGNLDADITMEPPYYRSLLERFSDDPQLGLGGGLVHSRVGTAYIPQRISADHVAGAVQFFRRDCFRDIGGYRAIPDGGIDAAAEIMARMHGWRTRTFPELAVREHRFTGSATANPLRSRLIEGRRLHALGYTPAFFFVRCMYRICERPALVGSVAALLGYTASALRQKECVLSPEAQHYLRNEQRRRLRRLFGRTKG